MPNQAAPQFSDIPRRICAVFDDPLAWPDNAGHFLRQQLDLAAAQPECLPPHYDLLGDYLGRDAETALAEWQAYRGEREAGAQRRHFATQAQLRHFLQAAAPARQAAGASLYAVVERWDDVDFQPMIASYLDELGQGVPVHNRYLQYQALLQSNAAQANATAPAGSGVSAVASSSPVVPAAGEGSGDGDYTPAYRSAAIELALARHGDLYLAELIGYNLARQQPSTALLVLRHEINELGGDADRFADAAEAAGSTPSALFTLRGVMARVADPAAFYRRVSEGYRLYHMAGRLPLPAAGPGPQAVMPPRDALDAPPPRLASYQPAAARQPDRPLIRHRFEGDEHAWEAIDSELRLLEARLAASESKKEAMQILGRLLAPGQQHLPTGLMAARIYSQLFRL